jgi:hypothetical protein
VLFCHKRNNFPNFILRPRRVALTNYMFVIPNYTIVIRWATAGGSKQAARPGDRDGLGDGLGEACRVAGRADQASCSTGTAEVVAVGCDESPCRSNFWPLAMPPT